jgi:hypothetical protein
MDINHLYHTNNINGTYQHNYFKDFDDEIYTIKDSNKNRISEIIREIQNKKDIEKPHLNQDKKEHGSKLSESMKKINELYYNIFDIKNLKKKYEEQKEKKYQEMNTMQKELNYQISKRKKEANQIKQETKEIDTLINKEIQIFNVLYRKDKNAIGEMLLFKNKSNSEFLNFLGELEINENNKFDELKKSRFKKLKTGKKITHEIISKIKKVKKKKEETKSSEDIKLLEEKLVYYLNSKGEKDSNYNDFIEKEKSEQNEDSEEKGKKKANTKKKK